MALDPSQVWTGHRACWGPTSISGTHSGAVAAEPALPAASARTAGDAGHATSPAAFWGLNAADEDSVLAALLAADDPRSAPASPWAAVVTRPDGTLAAACSTTWVGGMYWSWDTGRDGPRLLIGVSLGPLITARNEPTTLDDDYLRAYALAEPPGRRTPYAQIHRIPAGETAVWAPGQRLPRLVDWFADPVRAAEPDLAGPDALRGYLAAADAAVDALAADSAPLAATLSGGLDSTFVVASLARHASPDNPIHAFCHSPHPDAALPDWPGWQPDDFPAAQAMAEAYPGRIVLHRVINERRTAALDAAAGFAERTWLPAGNPSNQVWIDLIAVQAAELGADRLITGAHGNMVFSPTPPYAFEFYLHRRDAAGVAATVAAWRGWGEPWRRFLRRRVMPALAPDALAPLRRWRSARFGGGAAQEPESLAASLAVKNPPPQRPRVFDRETHVALMLGGSGLASLMGPVPGAPLLVDPFTDRALVEQAARIAPYEWLRGPGPRGFARRAGAGRVPDAIRLRRARGGQGMDLWWSTQGQRDRYVAEVEALADSPAFAGWIDADELRRRIDRWPWGADVASGVAGAAEVSLPEIIATNRVLSLAAFARSTAARLAGLPAAGVPAAGVPAAGTGQGPWAAPRAGDRGSVAGVVRGRAGPAGEEPRSGTGTGQGWGSVDGGRGRPEPGTGRYRAGGPWLT